MTVHELQVRAAGDAVPGTGPASAPAGKVFIKTYGCQMNVYDSQRMATRWRRTAMRRPIRIEDADLVVLNTCHIREKAAEKVYSELGRLRDMKARARSWPAAA